MGAVVGLKLAPLGDVNGQGSLLAAGGLPPLVLRVEQGLDIYRV